MGRLEVQLLLVDEMVLSQLVEVAVSGTHPNEVTPVVGAIRLKDTGRAGALEAGAWLSQSVRGRGLGQAALAALLRAAKVHGAAEVTAETASQNSAAIGVLRRLGFEVRNSEVPEPRGSGRSGGDVVVASRRLASGPCASPGTHTAPTCPNSRSN